MSTEIAVTAAFFAAGLHDAGHDAVINAWNRGCLELVEAMCEHAEFATELMAELENPEYGHPGVYAYEVCSPFGRWFGAYVLEHLDAPTHEEARNWLRSAAVEFFKQGN